MSNSNSCALYGTCNVGYQIRLLSIYISKQIYVRRFITFLNFRCCIFNHTHTHTHTTHANKNRHCSKIIVLCIYVGLYCKLFAGMKTNRSPTASMCIKIYMFTKQMLRLEKYHFIDLLRIAMMIFKKIIIFISPALICIRQVILHDLLFLT